MFAVDTNIVLDVLAGGTAGPASAALLEESSRHGALVVCGLVWVELAAVRDADETDRALEVLRVVVDWNMGRTVLDHAQTAWRTYLQQRRQQRPSFICPHCHAAAGEWQCPHCGSALPPPRHIMTDFLIGAHAEARGFPLITRDRGVYRHYFPQLPLLSP